MPRFELWSCESRLVDTYPPRASIPRPGRVRKFLGHLGLFTPPSPCKPRPELRVVRGKFWGRFASGDEALAAIAKLDQLAGPEGEAGDFEIVPVQAGELVSLEHALRRNLVLDRMEAYAQQAREAVTA